jgi:hypothetical protein
MKKILMLILLPAVLVTACVDSLDDYNVSQKLAPTVPGVMMVSNAIRNFSDLLATPNVNFNNFRLYVQQWATTTYTEEPRYNLTARIIPQNWWQTLYRDVLSDLKEAKRLIEADATLDPGIKANQVAQITILEVYAWSVLVNTFGNVPYSQALDYKNPLPAYDDAKTVYSDILAKLDVALSNLKTTSTGLTAASDILYAGSVSQWIKFGNSIKLKLAMVIADDDNTKARTLVEQAAPNAFIANADNARVVYQTGAPNNNPISNNTVAPFTTRQDFVVGRTIVDKMNTLSDPRRRYYFTTVSGNYVGGNTGHPNTFASTSKPSTIITAATFEALLLDYAEVKFLLAEAAERGYTLTGSAAGTAEQHYNAAITASIAYWYDKGSATLTGSTPADAATAATAYLANPAVAYTTAAGTYKQKIGEQKYLALNNRGYDTWLEWRRLDSPTLAPVSGGTAPAGLIIPLRLIYPISEQTANGASREAAAAAIGGDATSSKLFWDKF